MSRKSVPPCLQPRLTAVDTGRPCWVDADANVDAAIEMMERYQVRRLPVIADHKLVGIISQGDIARNYSEQRVGELVEHIS